MTKSGFCVSAAGIPFSESLPSAFSLAVTSSRRG